MIISAVEIQVLCITFIVQAFSFKCDQTEKLCTWSLMTLMLHRKDRTAMHMWIGYILSSKKGINFAKIRTSNSQEITHSAAPLLFIEFKAPGYWLEL